MADTAKRPKDMTPDEIGALPVGPYIEIREPITAADIAEGRGGRYKVRFERREVRVSGYMGDDIAFWYDDSGVYTFGQFDDGSWFKQPMSI